MIIILFPQFIIEARSSIPKLRSSIRNLYDYYVVQSLICLESIRNFVIMWNIFMHAKYLEFVYTNFFLFIEINVFNLDHSTLKIYNWANYEFCLSPLSFATTDKKKK